MARAGAAVILFAILLFLLVAPAPARRPVELPPQLVLPDGVDREAAAEPLLSAKPFDFDSADAVGLTVSEDEVARAAHAHDGLVFRCGGGDAAVLSNSEKFQARPAPKGEAEEDMDERPYDSDSPDTEWDSDSDDEDTEWDSDSDDEDDEGGIVGWFWRLAHRF